MQRTQDTPEVVRDFYTELQLWEATRGGTRGNVCCKHLTDKSHLYCSEETIVKTDLIR